VLLSTADSLRSQEGMVRRPNRRVHMIRRTDHQEGQSGSHSKQSYFRGVGQEMERRLTGALEYTARASDTLAFCPPLTKPTPGITSTAFADERQETETHGLSHALRFLCRENVVRLFFVSDQQLYLCFNSPVSSPASRPFKSSSRAQANMTCLKRFRSNAEPCKMFSLIAVCLPQPKTALV
jgi:hypothetical protein